METFGVFRLLVELNATAQVFVLFHMDRNIIVMHEKTPIDTGNK